MSSSTKSWHRLWKPLASNPLTPIASDGVTDTFNLRFHLSGILPVLTDHLYRRTDVFLRELTQNSIDAATERLLLEPQHKPEIFVSVTAGNIPREFLLHFEDNGIGLTYQEIHDFLATVANTIKRDQLTGARRSGVMGQFGIGFFSSFMNSDEVTVLTRSARDPSQAWCWVGRIDGTYTLRPSTAPEQPGTQVFCRMMPDEDGPFDEERVASVLRHYAGCTGVPITLLRSRGKPEQLTRGNDLPWLPAAKPVHTLAIAQRELGGTWLSSFSFYSEVGKVSGLAFINADRNRLFTEQKSRIYLQRMLLSEDASKLLPENGPFISIIANAEALTPNAAREDIHDPDFTTSEVSTVIWRKFKDHLSHLEKADPHVLQQILSAHCDSLLRSAEHDEECARLLGDHLQFSTSRGPMSLASVRLLGGITYYLEDEDDYHKAIALARSARFVCLNAQCESLGRLLANYSNRCEPPFLERATFSSLLRSHSEAADQHPDDHACVAIFNEELARWRVLARTTKLGADGRCAFVEACASASLRRASEHSRIDGLGWDLDDDSNFAGSTLNAPLTYDTTLLLNTEHQLWKRLRNCTQPERVRTVAQLIYHDALQAARQQTTRTEDEAWSTILGAML